MSIELSLEDVKKVALHYGFTLEVSCKKRSPFLSPCQLIIPSIILTLFIYTEGKYYLNDIYHKYSVYDAGNIFSGISIECGCLSITAF